MIGPRSIPNNARPQLAPVDTLHAQSSSSSASNWRNVAPSSSSNSTGSSTPISARFRQGSLPPRMSSSSSGSPGPAAPPQSARSNESSSNQLDPKGKRKANPLEDLIDTETYYVDDLSVIIKRVAAAWSRSNFPPPELDTMFRAIEAVYRTNKALLTKLNAIGPNPSSPKALGDLLMTWVVEIEPSYEAYARTYSVGFDAFPPIKSNAKLRPILDELSRPTTLPASSSSAARLTIDDLFSLPANRLTYYKKLFSKLLKSTKEGRPDHALLIEANQKLDRMIDECERGRSRTVSRPEFDQASSSPPLPQPPIAQQFASHPPPSSQAETPTPVARLPRSASLHFGAGDRLKSENRASDDSNGMHEEISFSSGPTLTDSVSSATTRSVATSRTDSTEATTIRSPVSIDTLERKLSCDRTLDIFTMQPKKCRLQISPPSLRYQRSIRKTGDVTIRFTPTCDPMRREIVTKAHVILLTDLLLICQRMTPGEGYEGQEFWLLYPPLSGKSLAVRDEGDQIRVGIMQREWLAFTNLDWRDKEEWRKAIEDCTAFSQGQSLSVRTDPATLRSSPSPTPTSSSGPASSLPRASPLPSPLSMGSSESFGPSPALNGNDQSRFERTPMPRRPSDVEELHHERQWPRDNSISHGPAPPRKQSATRQFSLGPDERPLPSPGLPRSASSQDQFGSYRSGSLSNGQPRSAGSNGLPMTPISASFQQSSRAANGTSYTESIRSNASFASSIRSAPRSSSRNDSRLPLPPGTYADRGPSPTSSNGYSTIPDRFVDLPPIPKSAMLPMTTSWSSTDPGSRAGSGSLAPPGSYGSDGRYQDEGVRSIHRARSADALRRDVAPSQRPGYHDQQRSLAMSGPARSNGIGGAVGRYDDGGFDDDLLNSPPLSPVEPTGPTKTSVTASMKCKAFLQHGHAQWKSLGLARLQLFVTEPGNTKQLVVESDKSDRKTFVSTIVLTDGVERVGKTGVAIELSDNGSRTGIVYMLQMKNEQSATGLFEQLLAGSDRSAAQRGTPSGQRTPSSASSFSRR